MAEQQVHGKMVIYGKIGWLEDGACVGYRDRTQQHMGMETQAVHQKGGTDSICVTN
jgi:hypothetical protein